MPRSILKPILIATLVAGTLDILAATILTLVRGGSRWACSASSRPGLFPARPNGAPRGRCSAWPSISR